MKFSGELIVKAPREAVFDKLKDAPFFASCVEGVHDLEGAVAHAIHGACSIPRSPISNSNSKSRSR